MRESRPTEFLEFYAKCFIDEAVVRVGSHGSVSYRQLDSDCQSNMVVRRRESFEAECQVASASCAVNVNASSYLSLVKLFEDAACMQPPRAHLHRN
jgi:hypothetical protein